MWRLECKTSKILTGNRPVCMQTSFISAEIFVSCDLELRLRVNKRPKCVEMSPFLLRVNGVSQFDSCWTGLRSGLWAVPEPPSCFGEAVDLEMCCQIIQMSSSSCTAGPVKVPSCSGGPSRRCTDS